MEQAKGSHIQMNIDLALRDGWYLNKHVFGNFYWWHATKCRKLHDGQKLPLVGQRAFHYHNDWNQLKSVAHNLLKVVRQRKNDDVRMQDTAYIREALLLEDINEAHARIHRIALIIVPIT